MQESLKGAWQALNAQFEASNMTTGSQVKEATAEANSVLLDSKQKPAWHVVVLSIFSGGIYNLFWFYGNLRKLTDEALALKAELDAGAEKSSSENLRLLSRLKEAGTLDALLTFAVARPILTTCLFAVPILNMIVLLVFANAAAKLDAQDSFARRNAAFCAFVAALLFGALTLLAKLPPPYQLTYTLACVPLAFIQSWLNSHWKLVENNQRLARQAFNVGELTLIIVGAMVIGLIYVGSEMHL